MKRRIPAILAALALLVSFAACKKDSPAAPVPPTPTPKPADTRTPTPTATVSDTLTASATFTPTPTISDTPTESATVTETLTVSDTLTDSATRTATRTASPTPTLNPIGAVIGCNSTSFTSASATIQAGQRVVWTNSCNSNGHTLYINDGQGNPSCPTMISNGSFPATILFSITGTYLFHCSKHSACGTGTCFGCTGMAGTITVN